MGALTQPAARALLTVGGRVFTDLSNLKQLHARATGANNYGTARSGFATAGYQVTAGKSLRITAARVVVRAGEASSLVGLMHGTADVGFESNAAPAGASNTTGNCPILCSGAAAGIYEVALDILVPATKYPAVVAGGSGTLDADVFLFGYEE